jgi:Na+-translocating ferredoxin:NAD+ oxidoreductase subunit B
MNTFLTIIILSSVGIICGVLIFIANRYLPKEPESLARAQKIFEHLPGANCGACGYPGCFAYAQALAEDSNTFLLSPCTMLSQDPVMLAEMEKILGIEISSSVASKKAVVRCYGKSDPVGNYSGIKTCKAASKLIGGFKKCPYGCLGLGDCIKVCPVDAISIDKKMNVAVVNPDKCTGCGLCVEECPMNVIELVPADSKVLLLCSYEPLRNIPGRERCDNGCVHCRNCFKACEYDAIIWNEEKAIPEFDSAKCTLCGECIKACPTETLLEMSNLNSRLEKDNLEDEKVVTLKKV